MKTHVHGTMRQPGNLEKRMSFFGCVAIASGLAWIAAAAPAQPVFVGANRFPPASELPSQPELPDPLVMFDGRRVTTREQWFNLKKA